MNHSESREFAEVLARVRAAEPKPEPKSKRRRIFRSRLNVRLVGVVAVLLVIHGYVLAQSLIPGLPSIPGLPGLFGGTPVSDLRTHLNQAAQILLETATAKATGDTDTWLSQIVNPIIMRTWQMTPLGLPQLSQAANQIGETIAWSPAMGSGVGGDIAWGNATVMLSQLGPLVGALGGSAAAQLATSEILTALGINNISVIGGARSFLSTNATQLTALQAALSDGSATNSGPTQQLAYVANANMQNTNIQTQQLQVSTATLETVTGLSKVYNDAVTTDNNTVANVSVYQTFDPVPYGYGTAFANEQ